MTFPFLPDPMSRRQPGAAGAVLAALCAILPTTARAQGADAPGERPGLALAVKLTAGYDDNVVRLPPADTVAPGVPAAGGRDETTIVPSVALSALGLYGRQRLDLSFSTARQRNRRFAENDGTTTDWSAGWQAGLPAGVDLALRVGHAESLTDYADLGAAERNTQRSDSTSVLLRWTPRPDRRLTLTAATSRGRNSLAERALNDYDNEFLRFEVAVDTAARRGFALGVQGTRSDYPNPLRTFFGPIDFSYVQHVADLRFAVPLGGRSALDGQLGVASRKNRQLSSRNFRGVIGQVTLSAQLTGKTAVAASWVRDTGTSGDLFSVANHLTTVNVSLVRQLAPFWRFELDIGRTSRQGVVNGLGNAVQVTSDATRTRSIGARWLPRRAVEVSLTLSRVSRDGETPATSWTSNVGRIGLAYRMPGP